MQMELLEKVEFYIQAKPLALLLADLPFNHPLHKTFVADLYDIVNEIRDNRIMALNREIGELPIKISDLTERKLQLYRIKRKIAQLQGGI